MKLIAYILLGLALAVMHTYDEYHHRAVRTNIFELIFLPVYIIFLLLWGFIAWKFHIYVKPTFYIFTKTHS